MNRPDESRSSHEDGTHRSLLDRISQALLGEPGSREELIDILRDATERGVIDRDSLDMIEGVFQVSEMKVRDIMVPRAQMDVVDRNDSP
jgi:magnesium and cobalt transporter